MSTQPFSDNYSGEKPKRPLKRLMLTNRNNMQVQLVDYGSRIIGIRIPNADGKMIEATLSDRADYDIINDAAFKGATCGRFANRIGGAQYSVNDAAGNKTVKLHANEGQNILHGGKTGFSQRQWTIKYHRKTAGFDSVCFILHSVHGENGFAGNLDASVVYTLFHDNRLAIEFSATCDRLSPINMCNHTYFNLGERDIHQLKLELNADGFLETNRQSIPTGRVLRVSHRDSWLNSKRIGEMLRYKDFDDCYLIKRSSNTKQNDPHNCARLISHKNKLGLSISSNHIGMQVYTGNYLPAKYAAIALEAQGLPDSVNHSHFQTDWVAPNKPYSKEISYTFFDL
ncbi:aldose epimerase family protein [Ningiella sp. W23]|uniref:aldose epimerase family protein n=1 Tax=Ningiella sp. W23 TaxID=3023715 RepID=UPI003757F90D